MVENLKICVVGLGYVGLPLAVSGSFDREEAKKMGFIYTGGFDVELAKKIELEGWKAWNLIPQKS